MYVCVSCVEIWVILLTQNWICVALGSDPIPYHYHLTRVLFNTTSVCVYLRTDQSLLLRTLDISLTPQTPKVRTTVGHRTIPVRSHVIPVSRPHQETAKLRSKGRWGQKSSEAASPQLGSRFFLTRDKPNVISTMLKILVLLCVIGMVLAGPIPEARDDTGSGVETPETVDPDEEKPEDDGYDVSQPEAKSETDSFEDPWTFDWDLPGWEEDVYDPEQPESEKPKPYYPEEEEPEDTDPYYPEQAEVEEQDPYYPDPEESIREDPGFYYPEQPDQEEPEPEFPEREEGLKEDHGGNQAVEQQRQQRQEGAQAMPGVHPWYQDPAPNYQQYNYDRQMYQYYNSHYYPPEGQIHYGSEGQYYQNPWAYNQHYLSNPDGSWVFNPFYNPEGDYYKKK
ncbi:activating signal cointegrator 1 complex subunit 2 homolog isoform X4 [Branchiostoma floridae]|uniref:Activating signal cointegrator 1 complex subunit 2 homolog isoform X4 n=1 Tax=Branchiostoma floridae TaxID=7739 RepID=A0A9J7HKY8_BRAFL|nr:activating signal cointegrator 1 complex subunit 2 homolog isoform X4 [Branchiostoma floridae]